MPSDGQVPDGWRVVRLGDVADVAPSGDSIRRQLDRRRLPVQLCNYTARFLATPNQPRYALLQRRLKGA